jgi:hypothetical protein
MLITYPLGVYKYIEYDLQDIRKRQGENFNILTALFQLRFAFDLAIYSSIIALVYYFWGVGGITY